MRVPDSVSLLFRNIIVNSIIGAKWFPRPLRPWALRTYGIAVGKCLLMSEMFFDGKNFKNVTIADDAVLNNQIYIDASDKVSIGARTGIASRCRILTATHQIGDHHQRMGEMTSRPVTIGAGVWIGADTTVLPGVTIDDGVVIGAGSLVTEDCESDAIYVGRPARLLRRLAVDSGEVAPAPPVESDE